MGEIWLQNFQELNLEKIFDSLSNTNMKPNFFI